MIPVYVQGQTAPVAWATRKQTAAEVAGKALKRAVGLWRKAVLKEDRRGNKFWHVSYFLPTVEQIEEWERRFPRDGSGVIIGPAYRVQTDIAH